MSLLWIVEREPQTRQLRMGQHLAFRWRDCGVVETACGQELDGQEAEWEDADMVVSANPPRLTTCPECAALTVAEVEDLYGRWRRGEPR